MSNTADSKLDEKIDRDDVFIIDDDCDEDVPGDFFDDFLKEDFMAGLDIVDDDQWENGEIKKDDNVDSVKEDKGKSNNVKESDEKLAKRKKNKRDRASRRERSKGIDADEFDIRRDPNKTKRDIQRDKAKCEKDKEKKLITEKLKLVETGLVPPGMEMEVDIAAMEKTDNDTRKSGSKNDSPPRRRRSRGRSVSPRPRRRSRNRSPLRLSPRRSPRRSPIRRKSRERISRERRSRERSIERTLRSLRRSRSSSLHRDRRSRYSPEYSRRRRRTRSRSRDKKKDTKKSFLQEIVEKLRESRPASNVLPPSQYIPPGAHMTGPPHMQPPLIQPGPPLQPNLPHMQHLSPSGMPVNPIIPGAVQPVPVPAPPPTFPVMNSQPLPSQPISSHTQYDPYDQSFFIGTPQQPGNFGPPAQQHSTMVQGTGPVQKANDGGLINSRPAPNQQFDIPQQEVGKLFHDKKITLSEFLAISAKPEVCSGSPVQLKDKIKVLSRCHDAIKILESDEKKFHGRLQIRKTMVQESTEEKYKSPLVKLSEAKIAFTEIPSKEKNKSAFTMHLNNLLRGIGLLNEVVEVDDDPEPIISSHVPKSTSPPPPPHISRQRQKRNDENVRIHNENRLAKMVQTDPMPKCLDCEKRRKIINKTTGSQTGELMTYSVSTQVTEDDFVSRIPKNQSLAALTPAQLLAQTAAPSVASKRYAEPDDFDIYPPKSQFNRNSFDYARAAESYNSSSGTLNPRFLPSERDREEQLSNSMFPGARGRGTLNNFDSGSRYSSYY